MSRPTMKELQEAVKEGLGYVHVNDGPDRLWATVTDDFGGCLLKDLTAAHFAELRRNDRGEVNVCVSDRVGMTATIVTGRFRQAAWDNDDLGAGMWYTLHDVALSESQIEDVQVKFIRVYTPVVGRSTIGLTTVNENFRDATRRLRKGESITIKLDKLNMEHNGWKNSMPWTASSGPRNGRILFHDRMCTTIPMQNAIGHAAIKLSIEKVRAFQVLLIVLNGGYPVDLHSVEIDIGHEHGPIPLSFRLNVPDLLRYGLSHGAGYHADHRAMLRSQHSLEEIGMGGVERWAAWWSDPNNRPVIDHWLRPDDEASPMATLEGLVRAAWKPGAKLYAYPKTLKVAMHNMGLSDLFDGGKLKPDDVDAAKVAKALAEAHNHNKHIGNWLGDDYRVVSNFAVRAEVFMSFLVAYGILVAAGIGEDVEKAPSGLRSRWLRVIRECYVEFIKPQIAELPESMW